MEQKQKLRIKEAVSNQRARAVDWGFAESTQKKTPYLWIEFAFLDIAGDNDEQITIIKEFYLTDNTIEFVLKTLGVMGWKGRSIFELDKHDRTAFDLGKKEVLITTEMQEFEGKMYAKVKFINDPDFNGSKPIQHDGIKSLDAKLKAKILAYRTKVGEINPKDEEIGF